MLNEARFSLLIDSVQPLVELTAECSLCGAITMEPLELAWLDRYIRCSNCEHVLPLRDGLLVALRAQTANAQRLLDRLA